MKMKRARFKQIIKEELEKLQKEGKLDEEVFSPEEFENQLHKILNDVEFVVYHASGNKKEQMKRDALEIQSAVRNYLINRQKEDEE